MWLLALAFLFLLLVYGIWPYRFFKKLGIPGPQPLPFIGTFFHYRKGILNFDQNCYQKYGKIWGIYDGRKPVMVILDPTIIKTILVKECYTYFTNRRKFPLNGDLESAVSIASDEQWKRIRTVLSPTFTSGRLKEMYPLILSNGEKLWKNVQKKVDNDEPIAMKDLFGAYSMDVITSTSFSVDVDSMNNPNDPFITHLKKFLKFSFFSPLLLLLVIFPFLAPVLEKFNFTIAPASFMNFFVNAVKKIKDDRQKNTCTNRVDFLQLMMDSQVSGEISEEAHPYKALTDKEIIAQAIIFIFAGYETTSSALSFLSYCLATHPDVQQRLQDEIDEALPDQVLRDILHCHLPRFLCPLDLVQIFGFILRSEFAPDLPDYLFAKVATPTYDAILQMEYLDMAVNETLRLYPPGGRLERVCKSTVEINGVTIPEGTVTLIPAYVLHRDPEYWPEPEEFRPERFSKENKETIDPYIFLPFGAGPRNCIGMRFALLTLKVAVVVLLQRYSFRTCKETLIPMELDTKGFMQPKKPIVLKTVPRFRAETEEKMN